jgi:D-xylose transport system permease protein
VPLTLVIVGVGIGVWNGFWIAHYKIPPFIITLGMLTIARGLALTLSGGSSVPVADRAFQKIGSSYLPPMIALAILVAAGVLYIVFQMKSIADSKKYGVRIAPDKLISSIVVAGLGFAMAFYVFGRYDGLPIPVATFAIIAGVGVFVLGNTRFGRRLYAMGGNEEAARLSGINVFQTKMIVYVTVSVLSALAGIMLASRLNGASPNLGTMFELDAIASVVIGGTSLSGGSGRIGGTIIGALIIGVLNNGMSLLGISAFYQLIIKGLIIILAVWFDVLQKKK